jgi:hypothetical protein
MSAVVREWCGLCGADVARCTCREPQRLALTLPVRAVLLGAGFDPERVERALDSELQLERRVGLEVLREACGAVRLAMAQSSQLERALITYGVLLELGHSHPAAMRRAARESATRPS